MKQVILLLAMLSICSMVTADLNEKISMDFRDTDVREICKVIASRSGMGIITEKSVRGQLNISLKNLTVRQALDLVADASGFTWVQKHGTVLLTDERKLGRELKVINLKNISAEEVARIISISVHSDLKIATCTDSNSVIINGSRTAISEAMLIVGHIDRPGNYIKASLKFMNGTQLLEKIDFSAKAGENIKFSEHFKFKPVNEGKKKVYSMLAMDCELKIGSISNSGLLDASINVDLKKSDKTVGNESNTSYSGQFQAEKGKTTQVLATSEFESIKVIFTWEK